MKLEKDDIIRMKFSVMKAPILPVSITDHTFLKSLVNLMSSESMDEAYELLENHIRKEVRFDKIVISRYPQVLRNVISKCEVKIGFEISNASDLNRIKLINYDLADKIKQCYDIRI